MGIIKADFIYLFKYKTIIIHLFKLGHTIYYLLPSTPEILAFPLVKYPIKFCNLEVYYSASEIKVQIILSDVLLLIYIYTIVKLF